MTPFPPFDHNHVIPPFRIDPTRSDQTSPYDCSILDVCQTFGTSPERIEILKKFLDFRDRMTKAGISSGFQWLDGSFIENIEVSEKRPPKDLDLVTFYVGNEFDPSTGGYKNINAQILTSFPDFASRANAKANYKLDHFVIDITNNPFATVMMSSWLLQLFSHNRKGHWKGILQIPINTTSDDQTALSYLNTL